jgi:[acyl-carrier-protein] S-malonyltransferase
MKKAFLFPGQGAQWVGMGQDLYENCLVARRVFEEADKVMGFSLSKLCFEGPFEELTKTENCQPAILTASIAALEALRASFLNIMPSYVAGLSLGEYSALVAAGSLEFTDAVYLVRKRGEFMEAAAQKNPGKMTCILGLDFPVVGLICEKTGCEVANLNCPGQVVISGKIDQLQTAHQMAAEQGAAKVIPLDVSGAFHSSLMDEASHMLSQEIEKIKFHAPRYPLICNVDAVPQTDPALIMKNLIKQVNSATRWEVSMRYLLQEGAQVCFEIGPGSVLRGLFRKIDAGMKVIPAGRWSEVQDLREYGVD